MLWNKELSCKTAMYVVFFRDQASVDIRSLYTFTAIVRALEKATSTNFKNDAIAERLRQNGNEKFDGEKYIEAIECYNKSLCFAEIGSKACGLAYANRS